MAIGSSFANLQNGLMKRYDTRFLGKVVWNKGALGAFIKKVKWSGSQPVYPIRTGNSPARSAVFSIVKSKSESQYTRIQQAQLTWRKDYGRATIEGLLMEAASDKMGTFYDQFVAQLDGISDAVAASFSQKVFRSGSGAKGRINATVTGTTLTLAQPEDIVNFEVGEDIQFAADEATSAVRAGGPLTVSKILDLKAGQLLMSANLNTITGLTANDFIFTDGDRDPASSPAQRCISGLQAWGPTSVTGGESFNNMDRSNDARLRMVIVDGTKLSEEEALIVGMTETKRYGGRVDKIFLNPTRMGNLQLQAQGRFRPVETKGPYGIGFKGIEVNLSNGAGAIEVYDDPYCPVNDAWGLEMSSWQYYGCGDSNVPRLLGHDGNKILRQTDDDGVECRMGYYGEMGTNAPCHNFRATF